MSVELLLQGMIVQSGNDASVALAEHVASSVEVFAGLMNWTAEDRFKAFPYDNPSRFGIGLEYNPVCK